MIFERRLKLHSPCRALATSSVQTTFTFWGSSIIAFIHDNIITSGFSIVSIKKVSLTLERLCLLELADFRAWLPFLSGWEGWWTSPCVREVTFSFQSHGELPGPTHTVQIREVGTRCILWHVHFHTCFRQAGRQWGTHLLSLTMQELSPSAGMGRAISWRSASFSATRLILSLCSFCSLSGKQVEGRRPMKHNFKNSLYFMLVLLHSYCWGLWHERHVILSLFLPSRRERTNDWKKNFCKKILLLAWFYEGLCCCGMLPWLPLGNKKEISIFECFSWEWSIRYCLWHDNCPCQDSGYPCLYLNRWSMANPGELLL